MYPRVTVNLEHIRNNVRVVRDICSSKGVDIVGVTKVFSGVPEIAQCYVDGGLTMTGDSRVENLKKQTEIKSEKWLIRPPMLCEVADLVKYGDASLNSEIEVIRAISDEVMKQHAEKSAVCRSTEENSEQAADADADTVIKQHKIVLMVDLGDIREGYVDYDEMVDVARETEALPGVYLYGIGVNLTCFSFITPDSEKMRQLAELRFRVEEAIGRRLDIVSGGNSGTLDLMMTEGLPEGVDSLRLGESLLFGKERRHYSYLPGTFRDTFMLEAQIVEVKNKPSLPWGNVGADSYGNKPTFTDRGENRVKAICAVGRQDFEVEICTPVDSGIIILGASSDHLMLDITDAEKEYRVGDVVQLELGYFAVMRAFTSQYVEKVYIG